jgi:hypothetical protein
MVSKDQQQRGKREQERKQHDPKTDSRIHRPATQRAEGRGRGDGSDDHRSGSESGGGKQ